MQSKKTTPPPAAGSAFDLTSERVLIPGLGEGKLTSSLPSSVTTDWKIAWTPAMIARDLMQNFRDANKGNLKGVTVTSLADGTSLIHGPGEFDLSHLFYLGSKKSADAGDVGGFGEGFKAAAVALLRDHQVRPIVISGGKGVRLRISDTAAAGTDMYPLMYDYFDHDGDIRGTYLLLQGMNAELSREIASSVEWFFDPGNTASVGPALFEHEKFDIYQGRQQHGLLYYRGQLVNRFDDFPIVIDYKASRGAVNKTFVHNRDRQMFKNGSTPVRLICKSVAWALIAAAKGEDRGIAIGKVIRAALPLLKAGDGHPFLAELAGVVVDSSTGGEVLRNKVVAGNIWGDLEGEFFVGDASLFAAVFAFHDDFDELESRLNLSEQVSINVVRSRFVSEETQYVQDQIAQWRAAGQAQLPDYFKVLGARSAIDVCMPAILKRQEALIARLKVGQQEVEAKGAGGAQIGAGNSTPKLRPEAKSLEKQFVRPLDGVRLRKANLLLEAYNHLATRTGKVVHARELRGLVAEVLIGAPDRLRFTAGTRPAFLITTSALNSTLPLAIQWLCLTLDGMHWHAEEAASRRKVPALPGDLALAFIESFDKMVEYSTWWAELSEEEGDNPGFPDRRR